MALSKPTLQAYGDVAGYVDAFYNCFYQFSLPAMRAFIARRKEIVGQLDALHGRVPATERRILFWLEDITEKAFDLNGPLMLLRL